MKWISQVSPATVAVMITCIFTIGCSKETTEDVATPDLFLNYVARSDGTLSECGASVHRGDPSSASLELAEKDKLYCNGVPMDMHSAEQGVLYLAKVVARAGDKVTVTFARENENYETAVHLPEALEMRSQLPARIKKGDPIHVSWQTARDTKPMIVAKLYIDHEKTREPIVLTDPSPELGTLSYDHGETAPTPTKYGDMAARLEVSREVLGEMAAGLKGRITGSQYFSQEFKLVDR